MLKKRISKKERCLIGENLIAFMESDEELKPEAKGFIVNWIASGPDEKTPSYYAVWDYVLQNYMPKTRPILFRSCSRLNNGKIASFTGRINCADRFGKGKGLLLVCDTRDVPPLNNSCFQGEKGSYECTFFPIVELLKKDASSKKPKIYPKFAERYIGEDEYIMRVNSVVMSKLRWCK